MPTIYPVACSYLTLPGDAKDLKGQINTLTWSTAIKPLAPFTVFGRLVEKLLIGNSGQLKFLPGDAKSWPWPGERCKIPKSLDELAEGYQIFPFGEPLLTKG